ncbi:YrIlm family inverse autotransporter adhesin [Yersinia frederiksenii]|uniref:YrIlm family inverse autotransporter adhesin n=1 Tax=Yersinia frederiksenii TaxID=29484 RepID=UPI0036F2AB1E
MHHYFWTKSFKTPSSRKFAAACALPRKLRIVAYATILFQLLLPLSLSFTPVPVIAAVPTPYSQITPELTVPYILGPNENIETVAKKFGMTLNELKRINIYRTFSKPFTTLTAGDEIDVPRKLSPLSIDNKKITNTNARMENKLAGHAQAGAVTLSNGNVIETGEQMLLSAANNEFNSSTQQWLSQFGTARVQLNVNKDFHLDGSAVDVLVPLYDNQSSILFTQLGARNKDSRNTLNLGAGVRTFQSGWMYGMNAFFDNDVTGKNRRVGVGAEAWTDYLKFSANSYFGTTDWHQSRDFADYNERPANGYDVRAEAYLPAYPQLGGKLMYEQYRGDEVALFGKNERQKNPHAVTAGINYTPVPLLTVGAEHRAGKGSKNDSSLNLQVNYRLGESWQSHIDPSGVAASRTLAGSRYDLVERNNNIVLDYQKQDLIRLTLPEQVTGESSSSATVNAQVTSKYGLERIEWDSAALMAAGGNLVQVSPQTVSVTLPPYQATRISNSHTLSAVAYDRQGNTSPRVTMQIVVMPGEAQFSVGNLTVTVDDAMANGMATNAVQAVVTDAGNQPIANQTVSFTASNGATVTTVIGTTGADGIATATLTSTTVGISNVMASVNGSSRSVATTFVAVPEFTGVLVNGTTFAVDAGFPSTGFTGAAFTLTTTASASDYTWSSNASWASVDSSGQVTFTAQGTSSPVIITATPTGGGNPLTYTFTLGSWFVNNGNTSMKWANASDFCTNQGLQQPTRLQLINVESGPGTRQAGSHALWSEWGTRFSYSGSGFRSSSWTSEANGIGGHYSVALNTGNVTSYDDTTGIFVVCRQSL